jgi:hypothetical protein
LPSEDGAETQSPGLSELSLKILYIAHKVHAFFISCKVHVSSRTMTLGSSQPLTEMSTRNLTGGKGIPARRADNLTAICEPIVKKMWVASTSHNPMGLHSPLVGWLCLFLIQGTYASKMYSNFMFNYVKMETKTEEGKTVNLNTPVTQMDVLMLTAWRGARNRPLYLNLKFSYYFLTRTYG